MDCTDSCGMELPTDWQNGKKSVKERSKYLLDTGLWSDCSFLVGTDTNTKMFHAHKLFLAMSSPVFEAMFFGEMQERNNPIEITDVQPEAFEILLEYIYSDCIGNLSFEQSCEVCYAAKKYLLLDVVKLCIDHIQQYLNPENACRAYEIGKFFDEKKLRESSLEIIKCETEKVLEHSSFEDAELDTILLILDIEPLNVTSEKYVFNAVHKWAIKECARRGLTENEDSLRSVIEPIIGKIRFLSMTSSEFAEGPALTSLLSKDEKLTLLMNISNKKKPNVAMPVGFSEISIARSNYVAPSAISQDSRRSPKLTCRRNIRIGPTSYINATLDCCLAFSADKPICILGVEISAQKNSDGWGRERSYTELLYAILLDADNSRLTYTHYSSKVNYGGTIEILFNRPIRINKNKTYKISVVLHKTGYYEMGEADESTTCDGVTFRFNGSTGPPSLIRSIIFSH